DGASTMRTRAEDIGFSPGTDWSEASMGTSAPGTALSTGAPAQVAGAEHFSQNVHDFYCSAIPLRHPSGGILGMLDITGSATALSTGAPVPVAGAEHVSQTVHDFYCSAIPLRHPSGGILGMLDITGSATAVTPLALAMLRNTAQAIEQFWATHIFPSTSHAEPTNPLQATALLEVASGRTARLGKARLSMRHAEILTLLDWHRTGLSATQLAYDLFGELAPDQLRARLTTVRAEISRLRKLLDKSHHPIALHSQPYRLDTTVPTDAAAAMNALHRGDITSALRFAPADVLPASEAPGIADIRPQMSVTLREAVLADATAEHLCAYLRRNQAASDVEAWMLALKILPPSSPRRAVATATLQRLTH